MAYSDKVLDHYENPRNVGTFDKDDTTVGTGMVGAPACGDVMRLQIKVNDDGVIEDAKFKTYGCGSAIASSSLLTEWVKGKSLTEASLIKNSELTGMLSIYILHWLIKPRVVFVGVTPLNTILRHYQLP
mgnify:CR=1 FL=1